MKPLKTWSGRVLALLLITAIGTILYRADRWTFQDSSDSPLFQEVLAKAYSRFRSSEVILSAGRSFGRDGRQADELGIVPSDAPAQAIAIQDTDEYKAAEKLIAESKTSEGIEALQAILKREGRTRRTVALVHRIADLQRKAGEWQEALKGYREVLRIDPNHSCCFQHMGDIYAEQGKSDMASRMFENAEDGLRKAALVAGSQGRTGRAALAKFLLDRGTKISEALTLSEELVSEVEDPSTLMLLARSYERSKRGEDALKTLDRVRTTDGKWQQAVSDFRKQLVSPVATKRP